MGETTTKTRKKEQFSDMMTTDLTSAEIRYTFGGKFTSQGSWCHPHSINETWEFIYMIRGTAHMYERDTVFSADPGTGILLPPGSQHGGTQPSDRTVSFFWLHFHAAPKTEEALSRLPITSAHLDSTQIPLYCRQILHISEFDSYPRTMSDLLIRLLMTEYAVNAQKEDLSPEHRFLNEVREWIRINTKTRALSAAEVAAQFGYNEDYLTRLFRSKTGYGLKYWINRTRIDHIRTALLTTDTPLKTIAYDAGFTDYKSFLKYFTYHESVTPTELREHFYRIHTNNH